MRAPGGEFAAEELRRRLRTLGHDLRTALPWFGLGAVEGEREAVVALLGALRDLIAAGRDKEAAALLGRLLRDGVVPCAG